jgi:hypothetical protein
LQCSNHPDLGRRLSVKVTTSIVSARLVEGVVTNSALWIVGRVPPCAHRLPSHSADHHRERDQGLCNSLLFCSGHAIGRDPRLSISRRGGTCCCLLLKEPQQPQEPQQPGTNAAARNDLSPDYRRRLLKCPAEPRKRALGAFVEPCSRRVSLSRVTSPSHSLNSGSANRRWRNDD